MMRNIFSCEVSMAEYAETLWLLKDKAIVLQTETEEFVTSIQQKYAKCQIIRDAKDLEDFTTFEPDTAYIFVGELRSEVNYLNDMSTNQNEKEYRTRGKEDGKDEKYIKEVR